MVDVTASTKALADLDLHFDPDELIVFPVFRLNACSP
jgi:hypothetical protein